MAVARAWRGWGAALPPVSSGALGVFPCLFALAGPVGFCSASGSCSCSLGALALSSALAVGRAWLCLGASVSSGRGVRRDLRGCWLGWLRFSLRSARSVVGGRPGGGARVGRVVSALGRPVVPFVVGLVGPVPVRLPGARSPVRGPVVGSLGLVPGLPLAVVLLLLGRLGPGLGAVPAGGGVAVWGPPPLCPVCGRVAVSWSSVPLCGRCRRRLARLPRPCRLAALRLAHARPAASAAGGPRPGQLSLAL